MLRCIRPRLSSRRLLVLTWVEGEHKRISTYRPPHLKLLGIENGVQLYLILALKRLISLPCALRIGGSTLVNVVQVLVVLVAELAQFGLLVDGKVQLLLNL